MASVRFPSAAIAALLLGSGIAPASAVAQLPWRFVTERVIAPPDGSKGELGEIVSLAIADDGTVYAMQKKPATILVFGPDGKYLRTIGAEGDGPGELRSGVIGVKGNLLMVQDWSARRFTIFQTSGAVVKTIPSLCCRQYGSLHVDSAGRSWVAGPGRGGSIYLRIDSHGTVLDTIPAPTSKGGKTWTAEDLNQSVPTTHIVTVPGQPFEIFNLRYDGLILIGRSDSMHFVLSRNGRDTVRIFDGPTKRLRVTAADKNKLVEGMIKGFPATSMQEALRKVAKASDIPDRSNAWNDVMLDRENRTWVSLPSIKDGTNQYGVFDQNGKYLGEVPFPESRATHLWVMGRDRMAVLEDGDTGLPQIRIYKLTIGVK